MKRLNSLPIGRLLLAFAAALPLSAQADFELTGPDGRRIQLKDNGTWRYIESMDKERPGDTIKKPGEALLLLERKMDHGNGCRFGIRLENNYSYEIQSFVPYFSAYRTNDVIYDTVSSPSSFTALKPGDKQVREFVVTGLTCKEIVRLQVVGGDRCVMGDLDKLSDEKGKCLERVRVVASELVRFDK